MVLQSGAAYRRSSMSCKTKMLLAFLALFVASGSARVTSLDKCRLLTDNTLSCQQATGEDFPKTPQPKIAWIVLGKSNVPLIKKTYLEKFPGLTDFHAEKNEIERIEEGAFRGMQQLDWVDLSYNKIQNIDPEMFQNCPSMSHLNVSGNTGLVIPKDKPFLNAPKLRWLDLNLANIQQLYPDTFKNLPNLRYLSLSGNKLATLPSKIFAPLANLNYLDLSKNQFATLPAENFKQMKTLVLLLEGNPWKCDCDLTPFIKWAKGNIIKDTVRCTTPHNKSWNEITSLECK